MVFINFEGLDGGGKSTQADLLAKRLRENGYKVFHSREMPADPDAMRIIKQISVITSDTKNTNMAATTETLLYAARQAQIIEECLIPSLKKGFIGITVRHYGSLYAIHHFIRGVDRKIVKQIIEFITHGVMPDITILCDADADQAYEKVLARGLERDRRELEGVEHFELMRKGFLTLAKEEPKKWFVIRSLDMPKEKAAELIWTRIKKIIKEKGGVKT